MTSRPNRTEANVPADVRDFVGAGGSNLKVLLQSDDFLVIDKPANLRMDGLFENTVEKLVYQCLPLLKLSPLKWVHQLDYATSGVLCIALNRPAAARASLAFAERLTKKQYLAVVRGHLDPLKWQHKGVMNSSGRSSSNSSSSTSSVTNNSSSSSISSSRSRSRNNSNSNSNISNSRNNMICCSTGDVSHHHQQDHDNRLHPMAKKFNVGTGAAVSDTTTNTPAWQEETKLLNLHACYNKFLELLATSSSSSSFSSTAEGHKQPVTAGMVDDHLLPLSKKTFVDFEKSAKLRKQLRKALKVCGVKHDYMLSTTGNVAKGPDEESADHGAAATATAAAATLVLNTEMDSNDDFSDLISTVATPEPNDPTGEQAATTSTSTLLLVQVPVAENDNDFRCTASRLRGKSCETIVRVLQYTYYNREPVTKLLLMPTTGRRHQLRVHCKVLGHPILGDFTYGSDKAAEDACPRMFLHAWKLRIPLTTPDQLRKRKQGQDVVWGEGDVIDVSTPDPFVVEHDALI